MKLINSKARFVRVPVMLHDGDNILHENILSLTSAVHVLRKNFPPGVTPIAIRASSSITTQKGNSGIVTAIGIGLTELKAVIDSKRKLRKKLGEIAKRQKFLITLTCEGYTIRSPTGSGEIMYGYGPTLKDASDNFYNNLKEIEKLITDPPETTPQRFGRYGVQLVTEPEPVKRWWQFWK